MHENHAKYHKSYMHASFFNRSLTFMYSKAGILVTILNTSIKRLCIMKIFMYEFLRYITMSHLSSV